jgi:hypothetical protein
LDEKAATNIKKRNYSKQPREPNLDLTIKGRPSMSTQGEKLARDWGRRTKRGAQDLRWSISAADLLAVAAIIIPLIVMIWFMFHK